MHSYASLYYMPIHAITGGQFTTLHGVIVAEHVNKSLDK